MTPQGVLKLYIQVQLNWYFKYVIASGAKQYYRLMTVCLFPVRPIAFFTQVKGSLSSVHQQWYILFGDTLEKKLSMKWQFKCWWELTVAVFYLFVPGVMDSPMLARCCRSLIGCRQCVDLLLQGTQACVKCRTNISREHVVAVALRGHHSYQGLRWAI